MYQKVEICGINTAKLKVLTEDEKTALIKKVRNGDRNAREELIIGNLRLVLSVIQSFQNRGENPDDLFQVGCIGLIKAIDNFDPDAHDVRFSTYGVPMIAGEIRRYLRDNSAVRVSRSTRDLAYRVLQARDTLSAEKGREPTEEEIAAALGVPRQEVTFALDAISDPVSLFDPVYSDGGESLTVMDQVRDPLCCDDSWLECMSLHDAMNALGEREKRILSLRFFDGRTQMEVAQMVGVSQAQVSRLEKSAVERIRRAVFVS